MKIKIWSQDNADEENADEIEIDSAPDLDSWFWDKVEYAVRDYAAEDHPHSDYWDRATFCVRVGQVLRTYSVGVEMEPHFYVSEVKPKPVPA